MTLAYGYATWRAAYDFALSEISKPEYLGWGRAWVYKFDGRWVAEIA